MTDKPSVMPRPYEIVSIRGAKPPRGADGAGWHHYVIAQGTNTIQGYRQGTLETVTQAVEENVTLLNERQLGNPSRGRVHLVITAKKKKETDK